jgi:riboflavin synthase
MFSGIIEEVGIVKDVVKEKSNIHLFVQCSFLNELKVDQSIAHNGVCLTVTNILHEYYEVVCIDETLNRTNLGKLKKGDFVNLERSLRVNDRIDGHIVQGHVDETAQVSSIRENDGSWIYVFQYDNKSPNITVEKGSICVNGVSLTVVTSMPGEFSVAVIPYTLENTNFSKFRIGDIVNIEFDILGKYVSKLMSKNSIQQR